MFIPALICVAMLSNCNRAEHKNDLVLASEENLAFDVKNEVVLVDREQYEILSSVEDIQAFIKRMHDSIQKSLPNVTEEVVFSGREKDEILSNVEDIQAFIKRTRDSIQKNSF